MHQDSTDNSDQSIGDLRGQQPAPKLFDALASAARNDAIALFQLSEERWDVSGIVLIVAVDRHPDRGSVLLDDASATRAGGFEHSARQIVSRIVPGAQLGRVPRDHVLYKSFYLLDGPSGRVAATPDLEGLELGGRLAVLYSGNDLVGALARDALGTWEFEVTPGGEMQREKSIRLGVNVAMYALCLDYKEDQVHIPFIMKRRRI